MRYKGGFHPSELRCGVTGRWVPFETATVRLAADEHAALVDTPPRSLSVEDEAAAELSAMGVLPDGLPLLLRRPTDEADSESSDVEGDERESVRSRDRTSLLLRATDLSGAARISAMLEQLAIRLGPKLASRVVVRLG